jgi:hypothetical protein
MDRLVGSPDLKLTFHIGMGKTGTSAIQASLSQSPEQLREHGVSYLGMWWEPFDQSLVGSQGIQAGARLGETGQRELADRLLTHMRSTAEREPVSHFVFSNEALFANTDAYEALYARLAEHVDLQFVVFVREPRKWLASAYAQWGIRHRPEPGPVPSFAQWAEDRIGVYSGLRYWHHRFGSQLMVRMFDSSRDVVGDFLTAIGLELQLPSQRVYETPEPAALLLQAAFDAICNDPAARASFSRDLRDCEAAGAPATLDELIARHFDQASVPELLSRWREMFDDIENDLGIDLLASGTEGSPTPSPTRLRERLLDWLMAIVLQQARRIAALEARLDQQGRDKAGPS